jgi:hypothetical protein
MSGLPDFNAYDEEYGLPSGTLYNLAGAESGFNPNAVSPTGPQGLFQQTKGFQGTSAVNLNPDYQANAAGAFLQPYAASGNLGGGLAAYTQGAGGGAGLAQSPQYEAEAAKGNPYAQNLLDLSNGGSASADGGQDFSGGENTDALDFDSAGDDPMSPGNAMSTVLGGGGGADALTGGSDVAGTNPTTTGVPGTSPDTSGVTPALGAVGGYISTILNAIENFALRGLVIVLAIVIIAVALIAMMRGESPVKSAGRVAGGVRRGVKMAARLTEVAA